MTLAGTWGEPTIDGPRTLTLNGRPFGIPQASEVKIVTGARGVEIAHVRFTANGTKKVAVLSAQGQLLESHEYAVARARSAWNAIRHDD